MEAVKLVAIMCSSRSLVRSSVAPKTAKPALDPTTSTRLWSLDASLTARSICMVSVTSSWRTHKRSRASAARSSSCEGSRRVAATRSPRASACAVSSRPRPRDAPVIDHVQDIFLPSFKQIRRVFSQGCQSQSSTPSSIYKMLLKDATSGAVSPEYEAEVAHASRRLLTLPILHTFGDADYWNPRGR